MTLAILCSGQGAQHAGMFDLLGGAPQAAALFTRASALLGHDPRDWVRSAPRESLYENRNAQLLCTLQALSAAALLADVFPSRLCVAGYSVGEVAAWGVAGLLAAPDVLNLVAARADAMSAARRSEQGLLFVRGLSYAAIENLCAQREAAIAIVNPGDAYVLGGERSALLAIAADAQRQGAARVVPIAVEVASHTYLMADAAAAFRRTLASVDFSAPPAGVRLFSGIDAAAVLDIQEGADKLAAQISHPIRWAACLDACVEAGADAFFELGPGRALAEMAASVYPDIPSRSLDDFKSLDGARAWLARMRERGAA